MNHSRSQNAEQPESTPLHSWDYSPSENEEHTITYRERTVPVIIASVAGGYYRPGMLR